MFNTMRWWVVQKRCNSSAIALELRLFCTNPCHTGVTSLFAATHHNDAYFCLYIYLGVFCSDIYPWFRRGHHVDWLIITGCVTFDKDFFTVLLWLLMCTHIIINLFINIQHGRFSWIISFIHVILHCFVHIYLISILMARCPFSQNLSWSVATTFLDFYD